MLIMFAHRSCFFSEVPLLSRDCCIISGSGYRRSPPRPVDPTLVLYIRDPIQKEASFIGVSGVVVLEKILDLRDFPLFC